MNRHPILLAALGLALVAGCGPNPKAPVKVMALVPNAESGTVTTAQVELTTVTDATALKGSVLSLVGGNTVVVDASDPLQNLNGGIQNQTDDQRYAAIVKNQGMDVRANYIDRAGVLWPADFHTWNMVTTFYNFERAYNYFVTVYDGKDPAELRNLRVMYWPEVRLNSATPLTDNALYLSFIKSFVVVPQATWQLVPVAMNIGVIGHETAHKAFSYKVYQDQGVPAALTTWTGLPFNLLKSIDEGFADFHGFGVTCLEAAGCRPNFLANSIPDERTVSNRNLARTDACMDLPLFTAMKNFTPDNWVRDPSLYKVGGLWAATLYQAANKTGKIGVMQKALIAAYDDESPTKPGLRQLVTGALTDSSKFTPEAVADTILAHVSDPSLQKSLCSEMLTRLQLACTLGTGVLCSEIPHCPATSSRDTKTCPAINP